MDILIKNMEMPKDNKRIFLCIEKDGEVGVFEEKKLIRFTEAEELPPHGRLGDLNKLYNDAKNLNYPTVCDILEEICCADTVLEASNE